MKNVICASLLLGLMVVGINGIVRKPDCFMKDYDQTYAGKFTKTASGFTCQRWDSQTPHTHSLKADMFPESTLKAAENFCRAVDGERFPWCYTTVNSPAKERCNVSYCTVGAECRLTKEAGEYMGTLNNTVSGLTCQRWDSQTPHAHAYKTAGGMNFSEDTLAEVNNYCRNYKALYSEPWCYTTEPNKRYEFCNPPMCTFKEICGPIPLISHGRTTSTPSATNKYDHEVEAFYVCEPGYEFPDQYDGVYCQLSGEWTEAPSCNAVKCPNPAALNANFQTTNPANEFNTKVTYTCNYGFELMSGDATRMCQSNKQWSGVEPNCTTVHTTVPYPATTALPTTPCPTTAVLCDCLTTSKAAGTPGATTSQPAGTTTGATTQAAATPDSLCPTLSTSLCNTTSSTVTGAGCTCRCSPRPSAVVESSAFIAGVAVASVATVGVVTALSIALCRYRLKKCGIHVVPGDKVAPVLP